MAQFMLFTCAPGFEMIAGFDTLEAAKAHIRDELASDEETFGDWVGIMPIEWLAMTETIKGGSLETKGEIAQALAVLDLRPSEMEVLAKEVAENCSTPSDHVIIQALKDAYEANKGEEMPDPYP